MENNPKEAAKKIYFQFDCNTYQIHREGFDEEYQKYGVTKSDEEEWFKEFIAYWIPRLSVDDMTALDRLSRAGASKALPDLIRMASRGDGYAKLWYANAIWNLTRGLVLSPKDNEKAKATAIELWESLVRKPITLTEQHRKIERVSLEALGASTPEEYVLNYAKRKLAEAGK